LKRRLNTGIALTWLPAMILRTKEDKLCNKTMKTNKTSFGIGPAIKLAGLILAPIAALIFTGCQGMPAGNSTPIKPAMEEAHSTTIILREGDVVKITFPGSPNLDTTQPIRRDGKLNLPLIGEMDAAGMLPSDLQAKLVTAYASQISTKEVIVQVQSSTFPVYVTGAVLKPGKVLSDHPMTALDAVMEAGGPNYDTANLKQVKIDRNVDGVMQHYTVDLKALLVGKETKSFYLQPGDIIYVPEAFSPF
jgi:polysaccharide export outer membrane protein